jgi:flagellar basal-body rod protein FlgC
MSGLLNSIEISGSGLTLQRKKMDVVSQNIANVDTTRTEKGGPYRRRRVIVKAAEENIPFKSVMNTARTELSRTNSQHLSGLNISRQSNIEISKTDGSEIEDPASSFRMTYDPGHPDADSEGFVKVPDIEIVNEMVDMMAASRAYEANTTAILSAKEMAKNALGI